MHYTAVLLSMHYTAVVGILLLAHLPPPPHIVSALSSLSTPLNVSDFRRTMIISYDTVTITRLGTSGTQTHKTCWYTKFCTKVTDTTAIIYFEAYLNTEYFVRSEEHSVLLGDVTRYIVPPSYPACATSTCLTSHHIIRRIKLFSPHKK